MINLDFGLHYALFVTRPSGSVICFIEKESIAVQAHKFVNIRNRKYSLSLSVPLWALLARFQAKANSFIH